MNEESYQKLYQNTKNNTQPNSKYQIKEDILYKIDKNNKL